LTAIDRKADTYCIQKVVQELAPDLLVSVSWRMLIPPSILAIPRFGGVNLHRGFLPRYKGAEPVRRALENGDHEIGITAHVLAEEIDAGEVLAVVRHPVLSGYTHSLHDLTECLKSEITPLFGPLLIEALDILAEQSAGKQ
ncbi:MAG: formyltransferase family protein, partial [Fibrobacterota bacterium]